MTGEEERERERLHTISRYSQFNSCYKSISAGRKRRRERERERERGKKDGRRGRQGRGRGGGRDVSSERLIKEEIPIPYLDL